MGGLAPRDRPALVRRNSRLLAVAQIALWSVLSVFVVHAPLQAVEAGGRRFWAGMLVAAYSLANGGGALVGGRAMDRRGRRPALVAGHAVMLAGALAIALGARGTVAGIIIAALIVGVGAGAALLGRLALGEMYPRASRGKAIGILLLTGTIGAVGAPPLVAAFVEPMGQTAVWLSVAGFAAVGLVCTASLRPDPSRLAADEGTLDQGQRRPMAVLFRMPPLRAALATIGVAQMAMVGIMGVATVVVHDHGGSTTASSMVVSLHLGGMLAFSPVIGAALDRWGRRKGLLASGLVAVGGAVLAGVASGNVVFAVGLFLVGLGWSGAYLGATAVVSDVTRIAERGSVLGITDLVTFMASTVGALAGGFLLDTAGLGALGLVMAAVLVPALALVVRLREPAPGRWAAAEA